MKKGGEGRTVRGAVQGAACACQVAVGLGKEDLTAL